MQRTAFDVGSIAALLRQTEANLAALNRPRQEEPRYYSTLTRGEQRASWPTATEPQAPVMVAPPAPIAFAKAVGTGLELEVQQLRAVMEHFEKRLEDELRAFLAVADKRLQAREEQLHGIGDTLQASADSCMDQLNRRVDVRLRELERASNQGSMSSLDEVWESIRRLQADCRSLEGQVQRCASSDDLSDRLREAERIQQQRVEEKLSLQDRRTAEHRAQLERSSDAWKETIGQRCQALEQRVWENQSDKGDAFESILKRLPEAAPIRELQEEVRAAVYSFEVQQRRLSSCEAKLSKLSSLEAKVDFVEAQTMQQIEDQAQSGRALNDVAQRLSQKVAATEAAFQRLEAQKAFVEAQPTEDRDRASIDIEAVQTRLLNRLEEADARLQRNSLRLERELSQQVTALSQKISDDGLAAQRQVESRLRVLEVRGDTLSEAGRVQLERAMEELRLESKTVSEVNEAKLSRYERNLQELSLKVAAFSVSDSRKGELQVSSMEDVRRDLKVTSEAQEAQLLRHERSLQDLLGKLSSVAVLESRVTELQAQDGVVARHERSIQDLTSRLSSVAVLESMVGALQAEMTNSRTASESRVAMDSLRTQLGKIDGKLAGVEAGMHALEVYQEDLRVEAASRSAENELQRSRLENLEAKTGELQVNTVKIQCTVDGLKNAIHGFDTLRTSVHHLEGNLAVAQDQIQKQSSDLSLHLDNSRTRLEAVNSRLSELSSTVQRLQSGIENVKSTATGLESRSETLRTTLSSLEVVVQSLQAARSSFVTRSEESATQPLTERSEPGFYELLAASESRTFEKLSRELQSFRKELFDLRAQISEKGDAHAASVIEATSKLSSLQENLQNLRSEFTSLHAETQETSSWEARTKVEVKDITASLASLQTETRQLTAKSNEQMAEMASLQEIVSSLQRKAPSAEPSSPAGSGQRPTLTVHQDTSVSNAGMSNVKVAAMEMRLKRLEELEAVSQGFPQRLQQLEDSASTAAAALEPKVNDMSKRLASFEAELQSLRGALTDLAPSSTEVQGLKAAMASISSRTTPLEYELKELKALVAAVMTRAASGPEVVGVDQSSADIQSLKAAVASINSRTTPLEEELKELKAALATRIAGGAEASRMDRSVEPAASFEARLSRLEELLPLDSIEASCLGPDSSFMTGTAPPRSTVMLTLNLASGLVADASDPLSPASSLSQAVRGAIESLDVDVLRVDLPPTASETRPTAEFGRQGTICWLSASDASAAEAELRRQICDPSSALRRLLPGLIPEDSSAVVLQSSLGASKSFLSRVEDLERSRELMLKDLGSVERDLLNVKRLACGALGIQLSPNSDSFAGLGDLSDVQDDVRPRRMRLEPPSVLGQSHGTLSSSSSARKQVDRMSFDSGSSAEEAATRSRSSPFLQEKNLLGTKLTQTATPDKRRLLTVSQPGVGIGSTAASAVLPSPVAKQADPNQFDDGSSVDGDFSISHDLDLPLDMPSKPIVQQVASPNIGVKESFVSGTSSLVQEAMESRISMSHADLHRDESFASRSPAPLPTAAVTSTPFLTEPVTGRTGPTLSDLVADATFETEDLSEKSDRPQPQTGNDTEILAEGTSSHNIELSPGKTEPELKAKMRSDSNDSFVSEAVSDKPEEDDSPGSPAAVQEASPTGLHSFEQKSSELEPLHVAPGEQRVEEDEGSEGHSFDEESFTEDATSLLPDVDKTVSPSKPDRIEPPAALDDTLASAQKETTEVEVPKVEPKESPTAPVKTEEINSLLAESIAEETFSSQDAASLKQSSVVEAASPERPEAVEGQKPDASLTATSPDRSKTVSEQGLQRRLRITGSLPLVARASKRSKDEEIRKAFDDMDRLKRGSLTLEDLKSYLCDYLGFGQAEAVSFHKAHSDPSDQLVSFDGFKAGYAKLNPFLLEKRSSEVIVRKPGSLAGQTLDMDGLENCEVYACDVTAQVIADCCKNCLVLIGPCEHSVSVRDCEDCIFWIATQQLRTRDCRRCTFYLYAKTEPIIESSEELLFAPWAASYPSCSKQFKQAGFDPEKNLWNAVFDFTGKPDRANWRILSLTEVSELVLELEDPPPKEKPDNPVPPITHALLIQAPLASGESCGQGIANIPQTRPALPAAPPSDFTEIERREVQDAESYLRPIGTDCCRAQPPVSADKSGEPVQSFSASKLDESSFSAKSVAFPSDYPAVNTATESAEVSLGEVPAPSVTVQGGMHDTDDDDSSEDLPTRQSIEVPAEDVPVTPAAEDGPKGGPQSARLVRELMGESDEDSENETPISSNRSPSKAPPSSLAELTEIAVAAKAKAKSIPMSNKPWMADVPKVSAESDDEIEGLVSMPAQRTPSSSAVATAAKAKALPQASVTHDLGFDSDEDIAEEFSSDGEVNDLLPD